MILRRTFLLVAVAFLCGGIAFSQPWIQQIIDAHGGQDLIRKDLRFEVSGSFETPRGSSPFVLKVSGGKSRLEISDRVFLRDDLLGQEITREDRRTEARWIRHGFQETFILPFVPIARLADYQYDGPSEGLLWFSVQVPIRRFLGYDPPLPVIRLGFDQKSYRLASAQFIDEYKRSRITVEYSDYRTIGSILLPSRIERLQEGLVLHRFHIQSVDLNPGFLESELEIARKGGN
jgi:hypothetical protein